MNKKMLTDYEKLIISLLKIHRLASIGIINDEYKIKNKICEQIRNDVESITGEKYFTIREKYKQYIMEVI